MFMQKLDQRAKDWEKTKFWC